LHRWSHRLSDTVQAGVGGVGEVLVLVGSAVRDDDWTAPGAHEVTAGVYRIPLPLPNDGLRAVNVYAILAGADLVLVDSGWAITEARAQLEAGLKSLGAALVDVGGFLVTHVHRDHYSQAVHVRREFGTSVSLGVGERAALDQLTDPSHRALSSHLSALRRCGGASVADALAAQSLEPHDPHASGWEYPDTWLRDGDSVPCGARRLDVVGTPGHTQGHVVFHESQEGLLFAGDHVLPTITPSIAVEPVLAENPLADFLASLAKVRQLPDAVLLPAHGPVAPSVHARVDELTEHHGRRLDETAASVALGAHTAFEVALVLRWTRRGRRLDELDLFNQMLAITETEAHLVLLAAQRRLTRSEHDGVRHYK
jgi:glyoxylase-like metal-dependent hydrolase (beta-lactamase superfamily II)